MDWTRLLIVVASIASIIDIALPSVPVARVWNFIWSIFHPTLHGHYLSAAQGRTAHLSAARRRVLWRQAFAYTARILRLRRRWSALGLHLQTPRIQNLVSGISRRGGTLIRVADADSVVRPRAKTGAQQRRRNTVAAAEPR